MKWEPSDVIRLVALIGAFLLIGAGAVMMWQGIAAEGAIDIKSSILSGSIKTGSAGLFVAFLGFCLAVFVLLSPPKDAAPALHDSRPRKSAALGKGLVALIALSVVFGGLAATGFGNGFGLLAGFLAFLIIPAGIAYLAFLENE